jgi:hypothetical protein
MAINIPSSAGVPELNLGNKFLEDQIKQQQPAVPSLSDQVMSARRDNAMADIPENTQSTSSAGYVPEMGTEEDYSSFSAPGVKAPEYNPSPFSDVMEGMPTKLMDARGNEITDPDTIRSMYEQERSTQASLMSPLNKDWNTISELREAFPDAAKPTQAGTIQRASKMIGETLADTTVTLRDSTSPTAVQLSAMTRLKQGLNTSTASTANVVNMAGILIGPMLSGAASAGNGPVVANAESTDVDYGYDSINDLLRDDGEGSVDMTAIEGGMARDSVAKYYGRLMKKLARGSAVDENNQPIDPSTMPQQDISTEEAGAIALQAEIDSGHLVEDVTEDGAEIVRLAPGFGHERYMTARAMGKAMNTAMSGQKQRVPVTSKGEMVGAARNVRTGDKKKNKYKATPEMAETKRIVGSVYKHIGAGKGYIGSLFLNRLMQQLADPSNSQGLDVLHLFKISRKDADDAFNAFGQDYFKPTSKIKVRELTPEAKAIKDKVTDLIKERDDHINEIALGQPYVTPAWEDYATHRVYLDPRFNSQRNKYTRAAESFVSPVFQMDKSTQYHTQGINLETANNFWNRIGDMAKAKNTNLSPKELELSFLGTLGRVLDVGSQVGMKTEQMLFPEMLTLVTPAFIQEAAFIGSILKSIVPTTKGDLLNNMATADFTKLDPSQQKALAKVGDLATGKGDRETWGYVLQAYVDAADYLEAKRNNTGFNPKVTVAIDANSAGLMFLASDIGNEDILSRVGLIWENLSDAEFQDTVPEGDPRRYFTDVAKAQSIDTTFGPDNLEKSAVWKEKLDKFGGLNVAGAGQFNKEFAKKTLLTTGYGKASAFHTDEARAFLKEYPEFKQEMLESAEYNGNENWLVYDLNNILKNTVKTALQEWQFTTPKKTVATLQMFDRVPHPIGMFGEELSFGRFGSIESGKSVEIKNKNSSKARKINTNITVFDPMSAAKDKGTKDEFGNPVIPGPGSAAINQVGPAFGQYRESIMLSLAIRHFNEGKQPADMLPFTPVFDNLILNSKSYPLMLYAINNIALPRVIEWDMVDAFVKDFEKQFAEGVTEIRSLGGEVSIGDKGEYKGFLQTLDREYSYLKGDLSLEQKEFKEFLNSNNSGWKPKDSRPDQYFIKDAQFINTVKQLMNYKGLISDLKRWNGVTKKTDYKAARNRANSKVKKLANQGKVYNVT